MLLAVLLLVSVVDISIAEKDIGTGTYSLLGGDLTDPEDDGRPEHDNNYKAKFTSNDEPGFGGGEFAFNVFDNVLGPSNDKWCCGKGGGAKEGMWVTAEFDKKYELSSFSRFGCDGIPDDRNHKGNLKDYDSVLKAFKDQDVVVHLAADRSMKAEWETVLPYNIIGVQNVFEAAKIAGVKRVVFGSSQHAVGGNYLDEPYRSILSADFSKVQNNPLDFLG